LERQSDELQARGGVAAWKCVGEFVIVVPSVFASSFDARCVSERKTRVSYREDDLRLAGDTQAAAAERTQTPMTPSKLVKRKSLGFVRLGFGVGNSHATEGKYPGLGLGLGRVPRIATMRRRIMDISSSERGGNRSQSLLPDRDKSKDRDDHETPLKEAREGS
jgi:hypothetical protein